MFCFIAFEIIGLYNRINTCENEFCFLSKHKGYTISSIIFLDRVSSSLNPVSSINEQEQKSLVFSHYPHHRHESSSLNKNVDFNDNRHLFSHIVKAQRHSDPHSIKWITEGPQEMKDSGI
jgi:hypothetical protein